jgi:hypothetical protein
VGARRVSEIGPHIFAHHPPTPAELIATTRTPAKVLAPLPL